jgi:hypothetical protein
MSKQAYRDGSQSLPDIKKNFDEVADLTKQFIWGTQSWARTTGDPVPARAAAKIRSRRER